MRRHIGAKFLFVIVGIIAIIGGLIWSGNSIVKSIKYSGVTEGVLTGYEESESYDSDSDQYVTYYHEVIDYEVGINSYTFVNSVGNGKMKYDIGEKITMKYDPENPENAFIKGHSNFIFGIVLIISGLIFALLPLMRR